MSDWVPKYEESKEIFNPERHRVVALKEFCARTDLHVRVEDIEDTEDKGWYEPPQDLSTGRLKPEGWPDSRLWEFLQEHAIFDFVRMYRTETRQREGMGIGHRLPETETIGDFICKVLSVTDALDALVKLERNPELWRFPGVIIPETEHPFGTRRIQETTQRLGQKRTISRTGLWPSDAVEISLAIFKSILEELEKQRSFATDYHEEFSGRPPDDWARKILVARLRTIRTGEYAVPVEVDHLWTPTEAEGETSQTTCWVGTTLDFLAHLECLERFIARHVRKEVVTPSAFLSYSNIALLLVAAGVLNPNAVESLEKQMPHLAEQVRTDWRLLMNRVEESHSIHRPPPHYFILNETTK